MGEENYYPILEVVFVIVNFIILTLYLPFYITLFVLLPLTLKMYAKLTTGVCKSIRRLDGQTIIITGANIGIGLETAKELARRGGRIILACRSMEKGKAALEEIRRETSSTNLVLKQLDLSSLTSVRKFCREIKAEESRLDILINNAGAATVEKVITADKLETNMQANHFGPFLLTNLLLDLMHRNGKGRIIMVSSELHKYCGSFDLENLNSEKTWKPFFVYNRTKLANILFTRELNRRLREVGRSPTELTVNALHPGAVRTALFRNANEIWYMFVFSSFAKLFYKNVVEGAQTTIHLAVSEEVEDVTGEYFADCQKASSAKLSKDMDLARKLWDKSVKAVSLKPDETIVW